MEKGTLKIYVSTRTFLYGGSISDAWQISLFFNF